MLQPDPSPAVTAGLSVSLRWPALAHRVGEAIRLVEAGQVFRVSEGRYCVNGMYYTVANKVIDCDGGFRAIFSGTVLNGGSHYHCDCVDFENGIIGWTTGYPPRIELEPGVWVRPCAHILAVHIARMVEAEEWRGIVFDGIAPAGSPHGALGESGL